VELKGEKKPPGRKPEGIQKTEKKKRAKKGRQKATVNDPIGFYCDCHRID
jgi:hypothetical protein